MVTRADHVAVVDVASVKADWDASHEQILTTIDLVVVESWKGSDAPASHMTVVQPGGTVGDLTQTVHGMTHFVPGERAVVFLAGRPDRATVVGMAQGKRLVRRDAATGRFLVHAPDKAGATFIRSTQASDAVAGVRAARAPARGSAGRRSRARGQARAGARCQARHSDRRDAVKRASPAGRASFAAWRRCSRAPPAAAYVRYTSNSGKMFKWPQSCVRDDRLSRRPDRDDDPRRDPGRGRRLRAPTWSKASDACTYLDITVASSSDPTPRAVNDGRNNVIFRTSTWCKLTAKGVCDPNVPYDPAALALTSVSASTSSGIIRDADIEVNASNFNWADLVVAPESARRRPVVPRSAERGDARDGPPDRPRPHLLPAGAGAARQHGAADPRLRGRAARRARDDDVPVGQPGRHRQARRSRPTTSRRCATSIPRRRIR